MLLPFLNRPPAPTEGQMDLIVLGSSSSEAFDYVIGRNPAFHPYWASGWSARGLRSAEMQDYIAHILSPRSRHSHVMLNFGAVDVLFNARYKAVKEGFYDFGGFVTEAVEGLALTMRNVRQMGFEGVWPTFIAPVASMPQKFWDRIGPGRQLPNRMMGQMYYDIFRQIAAEGPCFETFDAMSTGKAGNWLLRPEFARAAPDNHPSYIVMQTLLTEKLAAIPGMPPPRRVPHTRHYKHVRVSLKELMANGSTRADTSR